MIFMFEHVISQLIFKSRDGTEVKELKNGEASTNAVEAVTSVPSWLSNYNYD